MNGMKQRVSFPAIGVSKRDPQGKVGLVFRSMLPSQGLKCPSENLTYHVVEANNFVDGDGSPVV
jgi:hypothetical protein